MAQLTRESLRSARKPRLLSVDVPEWDGSVTVRELPHDDGEQLMEAIKGDSKNAILYWIMACVVDPETVEPIYSAEDIELLGGQSLAALKRICEAAIKFNQTEDPNTTAKN